jgi:DNA replication protein DnaC
MIKRSSIDPHLEIMRILEDRRNRSRKLAEQRLSEVLTNCAGIAEIENRIRLAGLKYNNLILTGELPAGEAVDKAENEIDRLESEKAAILRESGYGENYLDAAYECGLCSDTGYIEDEEIGRRRRCSCYNQLLTEMLYQGSNVPAAGRAGFDCFDPLLFSDKADKKKYGFDISPRENIIRIRDWAMGYIKAFKSDTGEDLYFFGPPGTGKTFVSLCIAKSFLNDGFTVVYMTAPSLFNTITEYRTNMFRDEKFSDITYRGILDANLLIIDDLGTESMTAARYSEFLTLLNLRSYTAEKQRNTILSTNMNLKSLRNAYDERIGSRIMGDFKIIPFFGDDLRLVVRG